MLEICDRSFCRKEEVEQRNAVNWSRKITGTEISMSKHHVERKIHK